MIIDRLPEFHMKPTDLLRTSLEVSTGLALCLSVGYTVYSFYEGSRAPGAVVANAANGKINSSSEGTVAFEARMPETPLRPAVYVNYEQKSKDGGIKVAGVYITGTNNNSSPKEIAQFDVIRTQNGFGVDIGDGVVREITRSPGFDKEKKKAIFVDKKLLLEIELNETPSTNPLLTFDKVNKITVYGKGGIIVLDADYLKEYPASANNLFNLAVFFGQNAK